MVYRRPPSRFGVNSLSMKLSLLISAICLIAGICAAALKLKSEEKQLVFEEHELLKHSSERLSRQFNRLIKTKINIAEQANNVVSSQLLHNESHLQSKRSAELKFALDGSIRSTSEDGLSAAFLPQDKYSEFYKQLINDSESLWKIVSPTLIQDFFNFYLVTKDNFIRFAPPIWALNVPGSFDFTKGETFNYAQAATNPSREAVWSKVYYDTIWHKWVVSVLVPIYLDNEFFGVTGSDIALETLLAQLPIGDREQHLLVFDAKGQLLAHPDLDKTTLEQYGREGKKLLTEDFVNPDLQKLVSETIRLKLPESANSFVQDGETHIINIRKVENLNWYIGIYKKRSSALSALEELKVKFFGLFILYAILVAL